MSQQTISRHRGEPAWRRWLRPRPAVLTATPLETAHYLKARTTLGEDGHIRRRPGDAYSSTLLQVEPTTLCTVDVGRARIAYYRPTYGMGPLRVGDRVEVVDETHPAYGDRGEVAGFRPDQDTPVGLYLDADDDREFIMWMTFDAVEVVQADPQDEAAEDELPPAPDAEGGPAEPEPLTTTAVMDAVDVAATRLDLDPVREYAPGDRVCVVASTDPDLNGITGRIGDGHGQHHDLIVYVEVAGFVGEPCEFDADELKLIGGA